MLGKTFLLISLAVAVTLPTPGRSQSETPQLPDALSEAESKEILRERGAKSHVEAAIEVAEDRLSGAFKLSEAGKFEETVAHLKVYEALFSYADAYARQLPERERKNRNKCLKEIEQGIFKQTRPLEAVRRNLPFNYREMTDPLVESLKRLRLNAIDDMLGGGKMIK